MPLTYDSAGNLLGFCEDRNITRIGHGDVNEPLLNGLAEFETRDLATTASLQDMERKTCFLGDVYMPPEGLPDPDEDTFAFLELEGAEVGVEEQQGEQEQGEEEEEGQLVVEGEEEEEEDGEDEDPNPRPAKKLCRNKDLSVGYARVHSSTLTFYGPVFKNRRAVLGRKEKPYIHLRCQRTFTHPDDVKQHAKVCKVGNAATGGEWDAHASCAVKITNLNLRQVQDGYVILDQEDLKKINDAIAAGVAYKAAYNIQ